MLGERDRGIHRVGDLLAAAGGDKIGDRAAVQRDEDLARGLRLAAPAVCTEHLVNDGVAADRDVRRTRVARVEGRFAGVSAKPRHLGIASAQESDMRIAAVVIVRHGDRRVGMLHTADNVHLDVVHDNAIPERERKEAPCHDQCLFVCIVKCDVLKRRIPGAEEPSAIREDETCAALRRDRDRAACGGCGERIDRRIIPRRLCNRGVAGEDDLAPARNGADRIRKVAERRRCT